ncbi:MAG: ABC transporter permease, partial [Lachnospiraceae bacterium]|nr:ABC transporter permease [Lachnospiraceae bacterium]
MNKKLLAFPYAFWAAFFILVPLGMIFFYGFTDKSGSFTLANILAILGKEHWKALWISIALSLLSTLICLLLAYPLALILSKRKNGGGMGIIIALFILPMWMNSLLRTLAWQTILEKTGLLNTLLSLFKLPQLQIINTPYAIILGMVYNFLPFMILPIYNSLTKIDPNVINAAYDLGADSLQVLVLVTIPLSVSGIISGITMVFVPALTTFVISSLLGGSKILLIGNIIEQEFTVNSNWYLGSG